MSSYRTRSTVLALCAALVGATLLLAPAAEAKAVTRAVSVKATPNAALGGTAVTFSGKLTKSPKGSAVKIQRKVGSVWKLAKATTTKTAAGAYAVKVTLPAKAGVSKYRAFAPRKGKLKAAVSTVIAVTSLRKTTFFKIGGNGPEFVMLNAPAGDPSAADGRLNSPYTKDAKVVLQYRNSTSGPWANRSTSTIAADGTFHLPFDNAQTCNYRVAVARKGLNAAAVSAQQGFVFLVGP